MNYTRDDLAVIALGSVLVLEEKKKWELLERYDAPSDLFTEDFSAFLIRNGKKDVYNSIGEAFTEEYLSALLSDYERKGIVAVPYTSALYPSPLRDYEAKPLVLYCMGKTELLQEPTFCIVGSRKTLPNILKVTEQIAWDLSEHFAIVTGAAEGGDYAATVGSVERGKTICVFPCGLDFAVKKRVHERVRERGLLVSPFPPSVSTRTYFYHIRNRIMAGMSRGVLVVSAGKKSGTLITAHCALEYGKPVYAFPYTIGTASGEGANALLKKGAYPTENVLDILPDFGINFERTPDSSLTDEEKLVLDCIREGEEVHVAQIGRLTNLDASALFAVLSALELKNRIVKSGGNKFRPV